MKILDICLVYLWCHSDFRNAEFLLVNTEDLRRKTHDSFMIHPYYMMLSAPSTRWLSDQQKGITFFVHKDNHNADGGSGVVGSEWEWSKAGLIRQLATLSLFTMKGMPFLRFSSQLQTVGYVSRSKPFSIAEYKQKHAGRVTLPFPRNSAGICVKVNKFIQFLGDISS